MNLVKCKKCKWVHFEHETDDPVAQEYYVRCFRCGNSYKDFEPAEDGDVPDGSTVQAIRSRNES